MSGMKQPKEGLGPSESYAAFFTHPAGFVRAVVLTRRGDIQRAVPGAAAARPRASSRASTAMAAMCSCAAATNVLLRDLNTALVVEAMMRGAKSIYVDYVDYDEIAHHAGVVRGESTDALFGLDRVVASLERVAKSGVTPRPYEIVLVSDHGQSQGATFLQRYGQSLQQFIEELMGESNTTSAVSDIEGWGPVNVLIGQLSAQGSVTGKVAQAATRNRDAESALGPLAADKGAAEVEVGEEQPALVVVGSGNLGGVWFPRLPGRQTVPAARRAPTPGCSPCRGPPRHRLRHGDDRVGASSGRRQRGRWIYGPVS